ncbi:EamA family transporter [Dechloromonas sp. ZY10]|uniref:EamA family transporter n=1 Tax=Dechloromonas aquae TaxID=2664436 RepID=UPI003526EA8B
MRKLAIGDQQAFSPAVSPGVATRLRDTCLTALAPLLWGTTYLLSSEILPPERPLTTAALRVLPAGALLLLFCRYRPRAGEWWRLGVLALLNIAVFQSLLFVAAARLPGGVAAVLGAVQPLLLLLLGWLVDDRRPALLAWLGSVGGIAGLALLLLGPQAAWNGVGVAAALVGAAGMALGTWLVRRWHLGMPVLAATGWQLVLGGLLLLPLALSGEAALPPLSGTQLAAYVYLSLAGSALAYSLWFRGLARLSPLAASALGLLSPLCASVLGWLVLGQTLGVGAWSGMALVLASVVLIQCAGPGGA